MRRAPHVILAVTLLTGLGVFAIPNPWLGTIVLLAAHVATGVVLVGVLAWRLPKRARLGWALAGASAGLAGVAAFTGPGRTAGVLMALHGVAAIGATLLLIATVSNAATRLRIGAAVAVLACLAGAWLVRDGLRPGETIANEGL